MLQRIEHSSLLAQFSKLQRMENSVPRFGKQEHLLCKSIKDYIMQTYNEILASLLESVIANPEMDIDEVLLSKAKEFGLNATDLSEIQNTNSLLTRINSKLSDLDKARAVGKSREVFIAEEIERITEGKSNEDKQVILSAIQSATGNVLNDKTE